MAAELLHWVTVANVDWAQVKKLVAHVTGPDDDWVHVVIGPVVQLLAVAVLRQNLQRAGPWLMVLALELLNEWHDLTWEVWPTRYMQYGESLKDILLTMCIPTILLLLARSFPHWFGLQPHRYRRRGKRKS